MAQDNYARLVGEVVSLGQDKGPFKPCLYCGNCHATITVGTLHHAAGLRCTGCDRHIGWISKRHADAMLSHRGAAA